MYELSTEYWFDSAHFLTDYNGKCENLHGHQWRVTAYVRASELGASGTEKDMVVDFATLKRIVREECDALDHTFLVEEGSLAPRDHGRAGGRGLQPHRPALPHHVREPGPLPFRAPGRAWPSREPRGLQRDSQQPRVLLA